MKNSKRIFGVALALIMIFNVFSVGTFAAFPDDTLVQLGIRTDGKATYAPGDTITLTFSAKVLPELGTLMIGGQYEIGFNDAVLEPYSTEDTPAAHEITAIQSGYDSGMSGVIMPGNATPASELYDWNQTIAYAIADDAETTFDATAGVDLFTVKIKVKDDAAPGTYTIGFNPAGYEQGMAFVNDGIGFGGLYGQDAAGWGFAVPNMYECGTCTFTVGSAAAAPTVTHDRVMGRMDNWDDANATEFDAGFVGRISNLALEFEEGSDKEIANIESIVVKLTLGDKVLEGVAYQLYAQADGSYLFRAVVKGAKIADTTDLTYEYIVTLSDDADGDGEKDTLTYKCDEPTSFNKIHTEVNGRR